MPERLEIGVRYCGGCNSRYDRVAVVKRLAALLPDCDFVTAEAGKPYGAVLVVCGCPSRCASVEGLTVPAERLLYLGGWEDLLPIRDALKKALDGPRVQTLDRDGVMALLPHRPPMLLVDRASRVAPGVEAAAQFAVDRELPCFAGHFPGDPVLPGIYLLECMAQTADLLLLSLPCYAGYTPLFMGVRKAYFRAKVLPGDQLDIHASLLEERRELGYAMCRGQILRGDTLVADAELQLSMQPPAPSDS